MSLTKQLYLEQQIENQKKRFILLRKQRTYLELAIQLKGADLPILQAAIDEINEELNYE